MRKIAAMSTICGLTFGGSPMAMAGDHLVTPDAVHQRLSEAGATRSDNLAQVDAVLTSKGVVRAAKRIGVDIDTTRRALPRLSDSELADLAQRVSALTVDPVAGYRDYDDAVDLLVVVMVVSAVAAIALTVVDHH